MFGREYSGTPERSYHGSIPLHDYRKVIIKEAGMRDAPLPMLDGSSDINWGYGGGGPARLADALAADAFDDADLADALGWHLRDGLVLHLDKDSPFVVSRDRIVLEGMMLFNHFVQKTRVGEGSYLEEDIQELVRKQHDTRDKLMSLLSGNALANLVSSDFGLR